MGTIYQSIHQCKKEVEVYHFSETLFFHAKSPNNVEEEWESDNFMVMTWLWNSMEPSVSANFMFHTMAKAIWDDVHATYSLENNSS